MTQREAFEAWRTQYLNTVSGDELMNADFTWQVWQAAQAQATANQWKQEVEEQVVVTCGGPAEWDNPKAMVDYLIDYHVAVALDPQVSSDAQALIDKGKEQAAAAQAQAAAEPVAWVLTEELTKRETTTRAHLWFSDPVNCMWTPIYTSPPSNQAAMRLALEALQNSLPVGTDPVAICERHDAAIAALEKALAL